MLRCFTPNVKVLRFSIVEFFVRITGGNEFHAVVPSDDNREITPSHHHVNSKKLIFGTGKNSMSKKLRVISDGRTDRAIAHDCHGHLRLKLATEVINGMVRQIRGNQRSKNGI